MTERPTPDPWEAFDSGPLTQGSPEAHPDPLEPLAAESEPSTPIPIAYSARTSWTEPKLEAQPEPEPTTEREPERAPDPQPITSTGEEPPPPPPPPLPPAPAQPVVVPGQYLSLKLWVFIALLVAVWIPAALVGLGVYHWWYHSADKAMPVLVVFLYIAACTLAALLTSMVPNRPAIAGTAIALMSAPIASTSAAAALYGMYVFGWVTP